jgi:hypothetical protein
LIHRGREAGRSAGAMPLPALVGWVKQTLATAWSHGIVTLTSGNTYC